MGSILVIPRALKTGISLADRLLSMEVNFKSTLQLIDIISSHMLLSSSAVLYARILGLCFMTQKPSSPPLRRFSIASWVKYSIRLSSSRINALEIASAWGFRVLKYPLLLWHVYCMRALSRIVKSDLMSLCEYFLHPCLMTSRKL